MTSITAKCAGPGQIKHQQRSDYKSYSCRSPRSKRKNSYRLLYGYYRDQHHRLTHTEKCPAKQNPKAVPTAAETTVQVEKSDINVCADVQCIVESCITSDSDHISWWPTRTQMLLQLALIASHRLQHAPIVSACSLPHRLQIIQHRTAFHNSTLLYEA